MTPKFTLPPDIVDLLQSRGSEFLQWQPRADTTPHPSLGYWVSGPRRPKGSAPPPPPSVGAAPRPSLAGAVCPSAERASARSEPTRSSVTGFSLRRIYGRRMFPPAPPTRRGLPRPLAPVAAGPRALRSPLWRALFYLEAAWLRTLLLHYVSRAISLALTTPRPGCSLPIKNQKCLFVFGSILVLLCFLPADLRPLQRNTRGGPSYTPVLGFYPLRCWSLLRFRLTFLVYRRRTSL